MPYASKKVGRFSLEVIGLKNAVILSIYEEPKLGALLLSTPLGKRAKVDPIIPPKKGMEIAGLFAEAVSARSGKIGIVSFSCEKEPRGEEVKELLEGIRGLVDEVRPS